MKKKIRITEKELESIIQKNLNEAEVEEGIGRGIKNVVQGVKGAIRGQGYAYGRYLSSLHGMVRNLRRYDTPNIKVLRNIKILKVKINASNMEQQRKTSLITTIDTAITSFVAYSNAIKQIEIQSKEQM